MPVKKNYANYASAFYRENPGERGGGTRVNFCRVCAAGLSEPLPHYSLFCDQLYSPSYSLVSKYVIFAMST